MINYKIVASDLDGTLLDSNGNISDENIVAIMELAKRGVFFVPASGRTYSEIPQKLKDISDIRYMIYSNGAVVYDRKTGEKVSFCIPKETACSIYDVFKEYDTHITFRHGGECYVDAEFFGEKYFEHYNLIKEHIGVITDFAQKKDNFREFLFSLGDIEVFSVFFHNREEKIKCAQKLNASDNLKVVEISEYNIEVFNSKAGKGNALLALCDMAGIKDTQMISVGDSGNDESMILAAGLGLAMSNACEALKAVSDELACSNDEHVVRYILSHYFNA